MLLADMAFVRQARHDAVEFTAPRTHAITSRDLAYNASETAAFSAAGIPNRPGSNKLPKLGTKVIFAGITCAISIEPRNWIHSTNF